jgi:hypothetical protein
MVCDPGMAVMTPPAQVVLAFGVGATKTELFAVVPGRLSVTDTLMIAEVFVFCKVIVSVEIPFGATVLGEKALLIEKSLGACTVKFEVRGPAGVLF